MRLSIDVLTLFVFFLCLSMFLAWAVSHTGYRIDGEAAGSAGGYNVIFILVDALRADHVGAYGYGRDTTPAIDSVAADGFVFLNAVSQSTWTRPSVGSIFTGLYPSKHKAYLYNDMEVAGGSTGVGYLSSNLTTIAEVFRDAGYETYGFVNTGYVAPGSNFGQGFERYRLVSDYWITNDLLEELENMSVDDRFFIYLHYLGAHGPYNPRGRYARMFWDSGGNFSHIRDAKWRSLSKKKLVGKDLEFLKSQYDGEIRLSDDYVGEIIGKLEDRGLLDNTIIVVTSDHGEEFMEQGKLDHGGIPYDSLVRVPLIIRVPGMRGGKITGQVRHVDLLPTLSGLCGLEPPEGIDGVSIENHLAGRGGDLVGFSERPLKGIFKNIMAVRWENWKYIYDEKTGVGVLYDLETDPREQRPIAGRQEVKDRLHSLLMEIDGENRRFRIMDDGWRHKPSEESLSILRDLGYIE